jgi:hypothetical protein
MTLPTVAEYFAQYAEKGHIFPAPGLRVRLRNGKKVSILMVKPKYSRNLYPVCSRGSGYWRLDGFLNHPDNTEVYDITAILDESGNVLAGDL